MARSACRSSCGMLRVPIGHRNSRSLGLGWVLTSGSTRTDCDVLGCVNIDSAGVPEVVREHVVHALRAYWRSLLDEDCDLGVVLVDWSTGGE